MQTLKMQVQERAATLQDLVGRHASCTVQLDLQRVQEENCRQKIATEFECFCAGTNRQNGVGVAPTDTAEDA